MKKGDKESWQYVYINNIRTTYIVSNYGRVYNQKTDTFLKGVPDKDGYLRVNLYVDGQHYNRLISRLVLEAFCPVRLKCETQANHKNGIHDCNYLWNLEWTTPKENIEHSVRTGLHPTGERSSLNVYSEELIRRIMKDLEENMKVKDLVNKYKIPQTTISSIKSGHVWKNVFKEYDIKPDKKKVLFTDKEKEVIREMILNKKSYKEICQRLGRIHNRQMSVALNNFKRRNIENKK